MRALTCRAKCVGFSGLLGLGLMFLSGCQPEDASMAKQVELNNGKAFPSQTVTLVVPFPPGGGTDALARQLANELSAAWGQAVVVKNISGASGQLAEQYLLRVPHDGHTIMLNNSSQVMSPALLAPERANQPLPLQALGQVALSSSVLIVPQNAPFKTVAEVLQKAGQETVFYASCGMGTPQHWMGILLRQQGAMGLKHVPYKGCAQALIDVVSGQVEVGMVTESSALPMIESGKVRALAITAAAPSPWLPQAEVSAQWLVSPMSLDQWYGFFVPADVPLEVQAALSKVLLASVADEAVRQSLRQMGFSVSVVAAEAFQATVNEQAQYFNLQAQKLRLGEGGW